MQFDFLRKEYDELEKANKKLEEEYKIINLYLRKVEMTVERKPKKTANEEQNRQK